MLYCLMDDRARTGAELAAVADVTPSTASVHLSRLRAEGLIQVQVQGRHRYFSLAGPPVGRVLKSLDGLAGGSRARFVPNTPGRLRAARTCYDHIAGVLGVSLHDRFWSLGWLAGSYDLTAAGVRAMEALGTDVAGIRRLRRKFSFPCLDWSERRSHLGGSLGAALLEAAIRRKWVAREAATRALRVTALGKRELRARFGVDA